VIVLMVIMALFEVILLLPVKLAWGGHSAIASTLTY
jgi:hypothetical protein